MTNWHDAMVDRPDTNESGYVTGRTIGLSADWPCSGRSWPFGFLGFSPFGPRKSKERGMIARGPSGTGRST